jgi:hypothetical protein
MKLYFIYNKELDCIHTGIADVRGYRSKKTALNVLNNWMPRVTNTEGYEIVEVELK